MGTATMKQETNTYTHRLGEVFTYEDREYNEIRLDFGTLTGKDGLDIEQEMQAEGIGFLRNEAFDGGYQLITAAKASGIAKDVLLALPLRDCAALKREAQRYLVNGNSTLANEMGDKLRTLTGDTLQIIDNELRAERHLVINGAALDTWYCLKLAAKAAEVPEDQILGLPLNEFLNVKMAVRYFLMGLG